MLSTSRLGFEVENKKEREGVFLTEQNDNSREECTRHKVQLDWIAKEWHEVELGGIETA